MYDKYLANEQAIGILRASGAKLHSFAVKCMLLIRFFAL
jgi:hypothetical protein